MEQNFKIEKYNKDKDYSFTFGAFPTFELIKNKPNQAVCLLLHSKLKMSDDIQKLINLCEEKKIEIRHDDKTINKIADKENCFVVGVFKKFIGKNVADKHIVLVNPSDAGNMGTIMRTMLGFDIKNLIVIRPCVDVFNPKVVRASMGAIFSLNIVEFDSVEEYLRSNKNKKYFFMLNGKKELGQFKNQYKKFDLVFGNEASGLPEFLLDVDESVVIRHS
ncbi:MAG: TrmH family RNA methyltransferase, partial [Clostridia bacterium]|nr:TrmH family RNA methyltransferase [Clostridia bacterium]